jgi:AbrB family looped-hinge helix DNA binding protein
MRRAAAAGWLCKASRGPHSGRGAGDQFALRVFHFRRVALGAMSDRRSLFLDRFDDDGSRHPFPSDAGLGCVIDNEFVVRHVDRVSYRLPSAGSFAMNAVTLSSKYQVVIPQAIRESLGLQPGQKFQVVAFEGRVELIPVEPVRALRGFMKGAGPDVGREKADRTL